MNGIEKITGQIDADVQVEIRELTARARAQAQQILSDCDAQAQAQAQAILDQGQADAKQRQERLENMTALELRKNTLAVKQELVNAAFDRALELLCALPEEEYIDLLANLTVRASRTGREQVIFSQKDRSRVGKQVVTRANELLARQTAPKLPNEITERPVLNKVITAASALLSGTAMLTVAEDTRPMAGGVILRDDLIETNCSFEALVRLQREPMSGKVAQALFDT